MWYVEEHFRVILGGNTYIDTPTLVAYERQPIFILKRSENDGQLGISFDIYDQNGERIAVVRENRIVHGNEKDYEISQTHERIAFIEKRTNKVLCDLRKRSMSPNAELWVSVKLYTPNGILMDFSPSETNLRGVKMIDNIFEGCHVGISVMEDGTIGICQNSFS